MWFSLLNSLFFRADDNVLWIYIFFIAMFVEAILEGIVIVLAALAYTGMVSSISREEECAQERWKG